MRYQINCIQLLFLLLVAAGLTGCLNLKQVNDYSAASIRGVQNFETLPYSFSQNCLAECRDRDIKNLKFNPDSCNCLIEQQADSTDYKIYKVIYNYLDGLTCLSDSRLTDYHYEGIASSLSAGPIGKLSITSDQAGAYAKLASLLTNTITNGYRKNKLKQYISTANQPLGVLLRALQYNITVNLVSSIQIRKDILKSNYFGLVRNSGSSAYEKQRAITEYYQQAAKLDDKITAMKDYSRLLQQVAAGHQQLFDNLNHLSSNDIKLMLARYAGSIKEAAAQIDILKI